MLARNDQEAPASQAASSRPTKSLQYIAGIALCYGLPLLARTPASEDKTRIVAGKCTLFWRKAGHKFSHPLGVKPEHQKYVRVVGQVSLHARTHVLPL